MDGFKEARSLEELQDHVKENDVALLYLYGEHCSVCHAVLPQIKPIVESYPEIRPLQADVQNLPEIAGEYTVFTIPVVLLFVDGREVMRFARFIEKNKLNEQLEKITSALKG
ncbi:Thioredoxin [Alkalibacterium subtropicum]|uniref:Thioredoxin n=1 Tax=Alkalibacterium subtropicum TaxID=753702 RepID=A0A1I1HNL2_9LACT|nr:thioredoxin family protein [Alkalibacterium subtropicum]SFC25375.1 Thioredoxin [Alkalibacterium subtropicum]